MQSHLSKSKHPVSASKIPTVHVKCRHCKTNFSGPIDNAICYKCGRSASRPLAAHWKAFDLLVPVGGLVQYLILKPHSPVAARQAAFFTLIGASIYSVFLLLVTVMGQLS